MGLGARVKRTGLWGAARKARLGLRERAAGERKRRLYRQFLSPGDLCFDVGANVGDRVEAFLRLGARVVAVEPQPACASILQDRFGQLPTFSLVPVALGRTPGEATIRIAEASTIATMSEEFIRETTASGRFDEYHWDHEATVPVSTLDALIAEYGLPTFVKIDVEGFEAEVLSGLSTALPALSFEFVPEIGTVAAACIQRLEALAPYRYSLSMGESMRLEGWIDARAAMRALEALPALAWGDVYARTPA
jgi:FkbM family methyltransferase